MQTDELDVLFRLAFVVLCLGVLICVYNITRPRGIYNAFVNGEEAELDLTEAEIRADEISGAFNNEKKGKQKHNKAKFGRPRGISNAFNNAEGARQDMTEAEVRFEQITSAFNNDKNGIQNHRRARIGRGESSRAANSETVNQEVLQIKNVLAKLIAYLFGEKNQFNNKDKSN
ncbi:hypothetical protein LR48_Vigan02g201800 [Vigna angularis]|uniref:Uncharacterized protein n=1 Tax=Phaseolus angularis TaxID=3914 RepID=A0A0L9TZ53_PHAAN|nr:hypothetical protein LR48_Vigan02g201800 [Vigna angularis]